MVLGLRPAVLTSPGFDEGLALLVFRVLVRSLHSLTRTPSARSALPTSEHVVVRETEGLS
ncbi:hypothetical protein BRD01_10095 [Halobacteriales archaeon QS_8_65_32]|nr:MAG: hypothetical protein BRD01_10095 [Halobacteriales archaeon QS_8_65_32]